MKKTAKLLALLMALVLCLSFAACGGKEEPETTTAPDEVTEAVDATTVADETTAAEGDTTAADETTAAEETTAADAEETTAAEGETTTEAAAKKPETTAEVVAYFNKAVDNVKANAKTVQQKYVNNYLAKSPTIPGGIVGGIYKGLGGDEWLAETLAKNGQGAATFSTKADIKHGFPVEDQTWASKLTAADVKSATCTEKNGVYTITILTKADGKSSTIDYGQGHNPKALNAVPPRVINDNIPGAAQGSIGTATMDYPYGKIVITVDAATGNVKTADYDIQWTINFEKMNTVVPLGTKSSYVVTF